MNARACYLRFAFVAALAPLAAQDLPVPEQAVPSSLAQRAEAAVRGFAETNGVPGIGYAIAIDGRPLLANGVGLADVENDVPATGETVFRLASISKPVTAICVLQLVQQGKLDLEADVKGYVPEWPQKQWPVSVRQLLAHTAGVRHYRPGEIESTQHFGSQREGLVRFAADDLLDEPGTKYRYSTYGYALAAAAVEARAETTFADFLRRFVAEPAGAPSLQDDDPARVIPHRAAGYVRLRGELRNSALMDSSYKLGGGGLCANPGDLARVFAALLDGRLLDAERLRLLTTEQKTRDGKGTGYGLGLSLGTRDGRREWSHSGAQSRVSTGAVLRPDSRVVAVAMCNLERVKAMELARTLADLAEAAAK